MMKTLNIGENYSYTTSIKCSKCNKNNTYLCFYAICIEDAC